MIQNIIVILLFVGVIAYYAYRFFRKKDGKKGGGTGCDNCH